MLRTEQCLVIDLAVGDIDINGNQRWKSRFTPSEKNRGKNKFRQGRVQIEHVLLKAPK